jgi:hypothetical protein
VFDAYPLHFGQQVVAQSGLPRDLEERVNAIAVAPPPAARLLIEIDGGAFIGGRHSRGTGVEADCEKTSAAAILGYRVIRATPRQVEDGRCLEWIRQALGVAA